MRRRNIDELGLSFLDVMCCGFGALILLLMIVKTAETIMVKDPVLEQFGFEEKRETIGQMSAGEGALRQQLEDANQEASRKLMHLATVGNELQAIEDRLLAKDDELASLESTTQRLVAAKQTLTDEMERLLGADFVRSSNVIGGITVDSEYIIFVIDTSGSMRTWAWGLLQRKIRETLDIYPAVKGIQVLNASGEYLFPEYADRWITDSDSRRRQMSSRLAAWRAQSESNPVKGIRRAISTFYANDRKISVYVFGDDFRGASIENVVDTVDQMNRKDTAGARRVRIHAVGFPVVVGTPSGDRFAALMRELTFRNGGTFVGLSTLDGS